MQQTFYIDPEEEISSVIDRLRKSMANENYFVVPKRALFIQSIVNLKLLKREADKLKKLAVIVTQDELGINIAEKAGLVVKSTIEEIDLKKEGAVKKEMPVALDLESETASGGSQNAMPQKIRLKTIGSDGFYDSGESVRKSIIEGGDDDLKDGSTEEDLKKEKKEEMRFAETVSPAAMRISPNQALRTVAPAENSIRIRQETVSGGDSGVATKQNPVRPNSFAQKQWEQQKNIARENFEFKNSIDPRKEKSIEKMFKPTESKNATPKNDIVVGKKANRFIFGFVLLCLFALLGVAIYLFLPSAKILITLEDFKKKADISVLAGTDKSLNSSERTIPARIIEKEGSMVLSYESTGKGASSGKKASGSLTIYNEFSEESQQLISSTRFESEDGKIFRIAKTVVVPGMVKVGTELKPGAIEVEVVADEPGSEYNIQASNFKIPGFKDSPKYEKFYAKSTQAMTGGDSNGNAAKAVSQQDLENAKEKTQSALKEKMLNEVKQELKSGEIIGEKANKIEFSEFIGSAKVGEAKDMFDYSVKGKMIAIVYSEDDAKTVASELIKKEIDYNRYTDIKMEITYPETVVDFETKTATVKAHIEINGTPIFDANRFKSDILGKDYQQMEEIVRKSGGVTNADIEFFPPFVSKVPKYAPRVTVEIAK